MTDLDFLLEQVNRKPADPPPASISQWVEGTRIMPTNTPFPGPWENSRTPFLVEIQDNMGPYSPVQITVVMKGAQIGVTAAAENCIGYWMSANPAEILYVSATDDLLENWAAKRLEPLIDSIGMRPLIGTQSDVAAKSRRSGDKIFSKEYPGGTLNMASAQSASGLRSDSKRILIFDEVDGAPRLLRTGEGTWIDVARARRNAWGARGKELAFSTPTTFEDSLIREQWEAGDRRVFKVPCPHCGTMDVLEFKNLKHEMRVGQLYRVWYECPHCSGEIHNHDKAWMMARGQWEPTAVSRHRGYRSYHISSMYAPIGALSWFDLFKKYLDAKETPGGERSFVNLYLGLPYKEKGSRPKIEKVIELRGEWKEGEVQPGVLFVTAGVDVQAGSKNDPENPPRLEIEVVGHGAGFRTWSLLYRRFEGPVNDPFSGAWEEVNEWARGGGLIFRRADGFPFRTEVVLIDSGDGNLVDVVFGFAGRWGSTWASKGFSALKKQKNEKGDEIGPHNFIRYRAVKSARNSEVNFVEISTNYYKNHIYNNLSIARRDIDPQRPGFCEFPRTRGENYFRQLTAEEKRADGSFHAGGRRNEALDVRVLNMCAGDMYLDARVAAMRADAKAKGAKEMDLLKINHAFVLELLAKRIPPIGVAA